jgi:hypothetical protein
MRPDGDLNRQRARMWKQRQEKPSLYRITFEASEQQQQQQQITRVQWSAQPDRWHTTDRTAIVTPYVVKPGGGGAGGDNAGHKLFTHWKCSHYSVSVTSQLY